MCVCVCVHFYNNFNTFSTSKLVSVINIYNLLLRVVCIRHNVINIFEYIYIVIYIHICIYIYKWFSFLQFFYLLNILTIETVTIHTLPIQYPHTAHTLSMHYSHTTEPLPIHYPYTTHNLFEIYVKYLYETHNCRVMGSVWVVCLQSAHTRPISPTSVVCSPYVAHIMATITPI